MQHTLRRFLSDKQDLMVNYKHVAPAKLLCCMQVQVQCVEVARNEGNLLYLLHVYCDSVSRMLEKHGFKGFGK